MACNLYEHRLHELEDYLDGRLAGAALDSLSAHLAQCASCRADVEAARECGALLRGVLAPAAEPSGAFWFRVQAGIRSAAEGGYDFWASLELLARRLAWTATLALVLLGGYVVSTEVMERNHSSAQAEFFPEPNQQPADREEVLLTLAGR